jgi:hypothetical protein
MLGGPEILVPELPEPDQPWPLPDEIVGLTGTPGVGQPRETPTRPLLPDDSSSGTPEPEPSDGASAADAVNSPDAPDDPDSGSLSTSPDGTAQALRSGTIDPPAADAPSPDEPSETPVATAGPSRDATPEAEDTDEARGQTQDSSSRDQPNASPAVPSPEVVAPTVNATVEQAGVLIVGDDQSDGRQFGNLSAACSAAESGDVVELRFDGRRLEQPIKLENRRLTIRAAEGFQPVLVFEPGEGDPIEQPRSMLSLNAGDLTLIDVAVDLNIPRDIAAEHWSLVELRGGAKLRVQRVAVTVRNAAEDKIEAYHPNVAVFRTRVMPGADRVTTDHSDASPSPISIALVDTAVRGEADLLRVDAPRPINLTWENGLVDVAGSFVSTAGSPSPRASEDAVRLDLAHMTIAADRGLLRMVDEVPVAAQIPIDLGLTGCIIIGHPGEALLTQRAAAGDDSARAAADDPRRRVSLRGDRNFYESVETFWRVLPESADGEPIEMDFDAWRMHWGTEDENLPSLDAVLWQSRPNEQQPPHRHRVADYRLDRSPQNPAIGASNDGHDAGTLPERLPEFPVAQ